MEPLFELAEALQQKRIADDICIRKARHNPASVDANPDPESKKRDREMALAIIRSRPFRRSWSKEVARLMGKELNAVSGRLAEAKALGLIKERRDLERIEGCCQLEAI